ERLSHIHASAAGIICRLCKENGATWVKAAQFLSCRPDILPKEYIDALQTLQSNAAARPFRDVRAQLDAAWGVDWEEKFSEFNIIPVATASVAQVHHATLVTGEEVAVKIRIPDVEELFKQDAFVFNALATLVAPLVKEIDVRQIVNQLLTMTLAELDFNHEVENLFQFSQLAHPARIKYPVLFAELCSDKVMVTGWVKGLKMRDYLDKYPEKANDTLTVLLDSYLQQVLQYGMFHADPHPGNFIVSEDGVITILDFGALATLSQAEITHYSALMLGLLGITKGNMRELFENAGFQSEDEEVYDMIAEYVVTESGAPDLSEQLEEIMQRLRVASVKIPDSFVAMARVLITVGGFMRPYDVKFTWMPSVPMAVAS
ncbi:MAG TPA: lipopolysaccharide core heptose(II) kinase RfaY, partial [Pseudomonadales bacterium]|nr:lipopolysaccharide core heptose(II) kinase RfaY [Pseudomonadales bacterium]